MQRATGLPMSFEQFAIRAEGLSKTFAVYERPLDRLLQLLVGASRQYGKRFTALSDISFSLPKGQVLGLVGDNGAGKSTLLQLICKTLTPTSGKLEVHGRVAALLELGAGFNPDFSGRENIYLNAAVLGLTQAEIEARYASIVEFSGVGEFIEQPVKTYSSGMYMRLAFSIATCVDPDILVIDEALSVGDGAFARKSFDRIMALRDKGATILFCSHSMYHIDAICDQAIWLESGKIKMLGSPGDVTRAYSAQLAASEDASSVPFSNLSGQDLPPISSGNARLLAIDASVDGVSGRFLKLRARTSTLRVDVTFQCDPALPSPSVAFGLETISGALVSSSSTVFDSSPVEVSENGKGHTCLVFPQMPLMRGKYRLTIFLGCERSIHLYDHAQYCVELDVTHEGLEQGIVFLPHAWGDTPVVSVS
jgi:lipopolysaccharide transport system ATP-binding protein